MTALQHAPLVMSTLRVESNIVLNDYEYHGS